MSWHEQTAYAADAESTGVNVLTDRIVTFTVVKLVTNAEPVSRNWLINPGVPIPESATAVHGITTEHATTKGRDPAEALEEIAATVTGVMRSGHPLVFFNAAYDLSILEAELRRHDLPSLHDRVGVEHWHTIIDPFVLGKGIDTRDRNFRKGRKYKLPDLCERYQVHFVESHDALADATGAGRLARKIGERDAVGDMGPAALHQLQVTWRREMCKSLREYFDSHGIEHDGVDGGWPLHTALQAQAVSA
jgi:DNA polymerase-3 subunit epsilon